MVEMLITFISIFISIYLAIHYYRKSKEDKEEILKEISKRNAENLSIKEINKLVEERVIDESNRDEVLPYKACPKCGSEEIDREIWPVVDPDRHARWRDFESLCNSSLM